MRILKWTMSVAVLAVCVAPAAAQQSIQTAFNYNLADDAAAAPATEDAATSAGCGCEEASCGCEDASCCCEPSCGCDSGCCSSGCNDGCSLFGDCCLGDAWTLEGYCDPCGASEHNYGGWISMGYTNQNERLSFDKGDELSFNDFPDHLNLDQAWLYVEKIAQGDACSAGYGYRFDIMYGAQAHAAQSYGNPRALDGPNLGAWDASLDHGVYGWAMPQAYGEAAYGDWSFKVGHWFTPVGYEVIPATGNFFYTHTLTHYNTEPFTHTGVLATYKGNDKIAFTGGWALGWDTGFDQFDGGNVYVGGITYTVNDDVTFVYMNTVGNLGWRSGGQFGFTQHIVGTANLSENAVYVIQSDFLDSEGTFTDPTFNDTEGGITNYLFYTLNDCWKVGGRMEWWKSNAVTGESTSFYDLTGGLNYFVNANTVIRPEVRYDWTPAEDSVNNALGVDYNQFSFSIDAVFTF